VFQISYTRFIEILYVEAIALAAFGMLPRAAMIVWMSCSRKTEASDLRNFFSYVPCAAIIFYFLSKALTKTGVCDR